MVPMMIIHTDMTYTLKSTFFVFSIVALGACSGAKKEVANLGQEANSSISPVLSENMDAVLWYATSAEREWAYLQSYEYAKIKLVENLKRNPVKPAIIIDLDETVLDNSPYFIECINNNTPYDHQSWMNWVNRGEAGALPGALDFLKFADTKGVSIYYVTNRSVETENATMMNMQNLGLPFVDPANIFMMDGVEDKSDRRDMVANNHSIVLLLGDNLRDFSESFASRDERFGKNTVKVEYDFLNTYCVLFPNPVYGSWESPWNAKGSTGKREFFKYMSNNMDMR